MEEQTNKGDPGGTEEGAVGDTKDAVVGSGDEQGRPPLPIVSIGYSSDEERLYVFREAKLMASTDATVRQVGMKILETWMMSPFAHSIAVGGRAGTEMKLLWLTRPMDKLSDLCSSLHAPILLVMSTDEMEAQKRRDDFRGIRELLESLMPKRESELMLEHDHRRKILSMREDCFQYDLWTQEQRAASDARWIDRNGPGVPPRVCRPL